MRTKMTVWLFGTFLLAALASTTLLLATSSPSLAQAGRAAEERGSYWRHHDGRWSHWDARDKRWYYTDGAHWYYHNGRGWDLYRFDKTFGRENFHRGRYEVPAEGVKVVVPRHEVYVPR